MKKNSKGFTLIELLVVVAIIGILAAVGTVAYTGYTEGAKKSSAKSNHASAVKYIAAEDQKCSIGATTAMDGNLTCDGRTGGTIALAAALALKDLKNGFPRTDFRIIDSAQLLNVLVCTSSIPIDGRVELT